MVQFVRSLLEWSPDSTIYIAPDSHFKYVRQTCRNFFAKQRADPINDKKITQAWNGGEIWT
jgi:hypothetical protein